MIWSVSVFKYWLLTMFSSEMNIIFPVCQLIPKHHRLQKSAMNLQWEIYVFVSLTINRWNELEGWYDNEYSIDVASTEE